MFLNMKGSYFADNLPEVLERLGQSLLFHGAVGMARVDREHKLIVVAFGGEHFGPCFIGATQS